MNITKIIAISLSLALAQGINSTSPSAALARGNEDQKQGPGWHMAPERTDWPEHLKAMKERKRRRGEVPQVQPGKMYHFEGENVTGSGGTFGDAGEILKQDKPYTPRQKINPRRKNTVSPGNGGQGRKSQNSNTFAKPRKGSR